MRISPSFKILQKSPPLLSIIILIIGNQDQMPALDVAIAIVAIGDVVSLKKYKYAIQPFRLCYLAEQIKIK
jgi:hypothetical protein